jgi:ATP-dependent protease HslVU (ClpYQ) peptidase subunit
MTCIAGLVQSGHVYLASDSLGTDAVFSAFHSRQSKLFRAGEFVMGFSGSFRAGQLIQYKFKPPQVPEHDDIHGYLCTDFVDEMKRCLDGIALDAEETEFLVGGFGRLFKIGADFSVSETHCGYAACGSGEDLALGALYVLNNRHVEEYEHEDFKGPIERLGGAISAATEHNAAVGGKIRFLSTDRTVLNDF